MKAASFFISRRGNLFQNASSSMMISTPCRTRPRRGSRPRARTGDEGRRLAGRRRGLEGARRLLCTAGTEASIGWTGGASDAPASATSAWWPARGGYRRLASPLGSPARPRAGRRRGSERATRRSRPSGGSGAGASGSRACPPRNRRPEAPQRCLAPPRRGMNSSKPHQKQSWGHSPPEHRSGPQLLGAAPTVRPDVGKGCSSSSSKQEHPAASSLQLQAANALASRVQQVHRVGVSLF